MGHKIRLAIKVLLFAMLFIIFYLLVDTSLIFHFQQLGFKFDRYLLNEYLSYPGGIADYLSIFLFQFAIEKFSGALVYTMLIAGMAALLNALLNTRKNGSNVILSYLPVMLLGYLMADYSFPLYYMVVLIILLFLLNVYQKFAASLSNRYVSLLPLIFLMPVVYYLLGGGAFLTFSASTLLFELFVSNKKKPLIMLIIVILALFIPWFSANYLFFITINDAFFCIKSFSSDYKVDQYVVLLFALIPVTLIIQSLLNRWADKIVKSEVAQTIQHFLMFAGVITIFIACHNTDEKLKIEIDQMAYEENWNGLLEMVDKNQSNDRLINFHTNRALYHTGQMPYKLFNYSQMWGVDGLFLTRHFMPEILLPSTQLFNELGYMNEAIHWANEAVSQKEYSPQIIEQLIISHIIDHNYKSAKLYINDLKKFPFFKQKALLYQQMVENDQPDERMLKLRTFIPYENFVVSRLSPNSDLFFLLEDHPDNKMAYEYLMSYYLLNNDLISFAKYFVLGQRFKYGKIPGIYQEALTYYMYELNMEGKPVPQIPIDDEILGDFSDYIITQQEFKGSLEHSKPFLEKFKKTYWYYLDYESPVSLNRKIVVE